MSGDFWKLCSFVWALIAIAQTFRIAFMTHQTDRLKEMNELQAKIILKLGEDLADSYERSMLDDRWPRDLQ